MRVAVLGLGEAGAAIAADLAAAGASVRGFDPAEPGAPAGVDVVRDAGEAVATADVVLSVNSATVALDVAKAVAPALGAGARAAPGAHPLFADLNTTAPALKRAVADVVAARGVDFADVALLGPVPGRGIRTPALVSGTGAERFAAAFGPLGMPVTAVGAEAGDAAARKLARSVFAKGLAAAVGEALAAAERLGCEEWLYADLETTLTEADARLLRRLVEGSRLHADRRAEEMAAAVAMLEELEVEPRVAAAAEAWLRSLARSGVTG
jgi:3-hydroxyisobutyrate dehydrogenase-like beta-hydroxyacid dehydrogenase